MKVLVVTPHLYDTAPGSRFRIEQWARYLAQDRFEFTFVPFEDRALHDVIYQKGQVAKKSILLLSAFLRRLRVVTQAKHYDVVFLYREAALLGPPFIEQMFTRQNVPIVYDFDDPIWLSYRSPTNGFFSGFKWQNKVQQICRIAAKVIVGNRLLAEWAAQHNSAVEIVPSTIDLASYPMEKRRESGQTITLGWTGSHSTLPFLESIQVALQNLARKYSFRLLVISHTDSFQMDIHPAEVISEQWTAASEAADLDPVDIGLAPFPDTGWTPWRCHGKVLQYMAAGIPTITSPIGILPDYITDGVNGLFAGTLDDWEEKISFLIDRAACRRELGAAGRRTIEERYSAQVWVPRVKAILESVA